MCGRFTLRTPAAGLADQFELVAPVEWQPRYNLAPTQHLLAIRTGDAGREVARLRWGLVPSWAKDLSGAAKMINARGETVADKPAFRAAFKRRRCLIPADGFYEWQKLGNAKQPYFIHKQDDGPFAFAGLWEHWEHDGKSVDSCTIITTEANDLMRPLHDRMPVILPPATYAMWLDPAVTDAAKLVPLLAPYPSEELAAYPVSTTVNNARNETSDCITPITLES